MNQPSQADTVLVEQRGAVTTITLNRPNSRNALREQECLAVAEAVRSAGQSEGMGLRRGTRGRFLSVVKASVLRGADLKGAVYGDDFGGAITRMLQAIVRAQCR